MLRYRSSSGLTGRILVSAEMCVRPLWPAPGKDLSQLLDQPWRKETEAQKTGQRGP